MVFKEIIHNANIKADDNIDGYTCLIYLNQGVSDLNLNCNLKLPTILADQLENLIEYSEKDYVNTIIANLLIEFVAYSIKKTEGYLDRENPFYIDYISHRNQFQQKTRHLLKPDYLLSESEDGSSTRGTIVNIYGFRNIKRW